MQRRAQRRQAGFLFGNRTTALADTHASNCFDEKAVDFKHRLNAAAQCCFPQRKLDTLGLARYIVSVLESSIILARAHKDAILIVGNFALLVDHLRHTFAA